MSKIDYFQAHMPENICFGCGKTKHGLNIQSYWEGEEALCHWQPQAQHQGWKGILNGGIIATLIDCHCMCTAMAAAYRQEQRNLSTKPTYRYATGTLQLRYLAPVSCDHALTLHALVQEIKGRKTVLNCTLTSQDQLCVEANVIAVRVYDSSQPIHQKPFCG